MSVSQGPCVETWSAFGVPGLHGASVLLLVAILGCRPEHALVCLRQCHFAVKPQKRGGSVWATTVQVTSSLPAQGMGLTLSRRGQEV